MKYKTIIEITTEAKDKHEAMDIVGEFLNGDIENGVSMRCRTLPLNPYVLLRVGAFLVLSCAVLGMVSLRYFKDSAGIFHGVKNVSAVQAPLKTSKSEAFRRQWQQEGAKKVFEYIKNN